MKKQLLILSSIGILFTSCSTSQGVVNNNGGDCHHPSENAVLWQQTAAEYDALCYQAFNTATNYLNQAYQAGDDMGSGKPPAIVMDLDETVLDNTPYNAKLILENERYDPATWNEWTSMASAQLIPGAKKFIDYATSRGIQIYFISNREESQMEDTQRNLRELGIDTYPEFLLFKTNSSEKADRRNLVSNSNNIIMFIGDNLADFHNMFEDNLSITQRNDLVNNEFSNSFGTKFIILPNPIYGDWVKTLDLDNVKSRQGDSEKGNLKYLKSY